MIFFTILFILMIAGRILVGYFATRAPFLGVLTTLLTWLSIVTGILAGVFILIRIIREFRGK